MYQCLCGDVWWRGTQPVCFICKAEIPDFKEKNASKIRVEISQRSRVCPKDEFQQLQTLLGKVMRSTVVYCFEGMETVFIGTWNCFHAALCSLIISFWEACWAHVLWLMRLLLFLCPLNSWLCGIVKSRYTQMVDTIQTTPCYLSRCSKLGQLLTSPPVPPDISGRLLSSNFSRSIYFNIIYLTKAST